MAHLDHRVALAHTHSMADGTASFRSAPDAYERYMGAWSRPLAAAFVEAARVAPGDLALDVGRGTGALTEALVERSGPDLVAAIDPSEPQVAACATAAPTADARLAGAEAIPFPDATFELGVGPGGAYCASLDAERRELVRAGCFRELGEPEGTLHLTARAWVVTGIAP